MRLALPPPQTFFHRAIKTAALLILRYVGPPAEVWVGEDFIVSEELSDEELASAIEKLVNALRNGEFGLRPNLRADAQRIRKSLFEAWGLDKQATVNVESVVANGYLSYIKKLKEKGRLIDEVKAAFSSFSEKGYEEDAKLIRVPMLNKLAPEFMEAVRTPGGVYMRGSVPSTLKFSQMKLGPHSACWGLIGLWASLFYVNPKGEYYLFPSAETVVGTLAEKALEKLAENHKVVVSSLRGRPFTSFWTALLLTAILTVGAPDVARRFEFASLTKSGQRDDISQQSFLLFSKPLALFVDNLDDDTRERLRRLALRGLTERGEELGVSEAAIEISRLIILALERVIEPEEVVYQTARFSYLQTNLELEKAVGLRYRDVENIVRAIYKAKGERL